MYFVQYSKFKQYKFIYQNLANYYYLSQNYIIINYIKYLNVSNWNRDRTQLWTTEQKVQNTCFIKHKYTITINYIKVYVLKKYILM